MTTQKTPVLLRVVTDRPGESWAGPTAAARGIGVPRGRVMYALARPGRLLHGRRLYAVPETWHQGLSRLLRGTKARPAMSRGSGRKSLW